MLHEHDNAAIEANANRDAPASRWELTGIIAVVFFCLGPFLNKPVHLDDPVYIWIAQRLQSRWWDFFGGTINWYGTPMRVSAFMMNPPLASYYLAAAAKLIGWTEPALHSAILIVTLLTTAGIYQLSRRLCKTPALATLIVVLSPVFIVSATTIMCDMLMLCPWVWAMVFWMDGIRLNRQRLLFVSALLILVAILTKYFAICLVPMLTTYAIVSWRRLRWDVCWLFLPLAGVAGYQAYTYHMYGVALVSGAADYAASRRSIGPSGFQRALTGLSFTGGCLATAVPAAIAALLACLAGRFTRWFVAAAFVLFLTLLWFAMPSARTASGLLNWGFLAQMVIFSAAGASVIGMVLVQLQHFRDADSLLLTLWATGTFIFVVGFNWTVSARVILPMAPAMGIIAVRSLEQNKGTVNRSTRRRWIAAAFAIAPLSMAVAGADQRLAQSAKDAATIICDRAHGHEQDVYFQGHWGFQYYMQKFGAQPLDARATTLTPGQLLVSPTLNSSFFRIPAAAVHEIDRLSTWTPDWIASLDENLHAGFYSDVYGPLPFAFGRGTPDNYYVYQVIHTIKYTGK